jgi:hypothetical protein
VNPILAGFALPGAYVSATKVPDADTPVASVDAVARPLKADPTGADVILTLTVNESEPPAVTNGAAIVIGALWATPTCAVGRVPTDTDVGIIPSAALAGATDVRTPKPKAATVTSAMRLKVVFVDICFLSISRSREFPSFGFELIS